VLRHGRSVANVLGLIASEPATAAEAYGLAPEGREQVRRAVAAAAESGDLVRPWRILSSPLLRSRESADVAAEVLGVRGGYTVDDRLTERGFGVFELTSDENYERVWARDRENPDHVDWTVESVRSVCARVRSLLVELVRHRDPAAVVLCTHGDVASTLLCASLGLPLSRHREVGALGNGEIRPLPEMAQLLTFDRPRGERVP
jgi:broad specificity phosphatase PhoE